MIKSLRALGAIFLVSCLSLESVAAPGFNPVLRLRSRRVHPLATLGTFAGQAFAARGLANFHPSLAPRLTAALNRRFLSGPQVLVGNVVAVGIGIAGLQTLRGLVAIAQGHSIASGALGAVDPFLIAALFAGGWLLLNVAKRAVPAGSDRLRSIWFSDRAPASVSATPPSIVVVNYAGPESGLGAKVLETLGFPGPHLESKSRYEPEYGFLEEACLFTPTGTLTVKRLPAANREDVAAWIERRKSLREQDIPVPPMASRGSPASIVALESGSQRRYYYVTPGGEGPNSTQDRIAATRSQAVGRLLARIHSSPQLLRTSERPQARLEMDLADFEESLRALRYSLDLLNDPLDDVLFEEIIGFVRHELTPDRLVSLPEQWLAGPLNRTDVVFGPQESEIDALPELSGGRMGRRIEEFFSILASPNNSRFYVNTLALDLRAILKGYEEISPLSKAERRALPAVWLLVFLREKFIPRLKALRAARTPERLPAALDELRNILQQLKSWRILDRLDHRQQNGGGGPLGSRPLVLIPLVDPKAVLGPALDAIDLYRTLQRALVPPLAADLRMILPDEAVSHIGRLLELSGEDIPIVPQDDLRQVPSTSIQLVVMPGYPRYYFPGPHTPLFDVSCPLKTLSDVGESDGRYYYSIEPGSRWLIGGQLETAFARFAGKSAVQTEKRRLLALSLEQHQDSIQEIPDLVNLLLQRRWAISYSYHQAILARLLELTGRVMHEHPAAYPEGIIYVWIKPIVSGLSDYSKEIAAANARLATLGERAPRILIVGATRAALIRYFTVRSYDENWRAEEGRFKGETIAARDLRPSDIVVVQSPTLSDLDLTIAILVAALDPDRWWVPTLMTGFGSYVKAAGVQVATRLPALHDFRIAHLGMLGDIQAALEPISGFVLGPQWVSTPVEPLQRFLARPVAMEGPLSGFFPEYRRYFEGPEEVGVDAAAFERFRDEKGIDRPLAAAILRKIQGSPASASGGPASVAACVLGSTLLAVLASILLPGKPAETLARLPSLTLEASAGFFAFGMPLLPRSPRTFRAAIFSAA